MHCTPDQYPDPDTCNTSCPGCPECSLDAEREDLGTATTEPAPAPEAA